MDPQELIQKQVQKHFKKLGKIRKKTTYYSLGDNDYDEDSGATSDNVDSTETVYMVYDSFPMTTSSAPDRYLGAKEVDVVTDRIAIFPVLDMTSIPKPGDKLLRIDTSETYKVKGLLNDPADAAYNLHVRKQ